MADSTLRADPVAAFYAACRPFPLGAKARAARAATLTAQDCPLLPTSDVDATPHLPAEPDDNLTPQQRLAVAALVGGQTFAAAARAAGCGRRTLFDWRQQPAFRRAVDARSHEALDVVVVRMRNLMLRATRVLGEAMLDLPLDNGARHAIRVVNSARFWAVLERPAEERADEPAPS